MKALFKVIFLLVFVGILALPVGIIVWGIEDTAEVARHEDLSLADVKRVKELVDKSKPVKMKVKQVKQFEIDEKDLNLLVNYGFSKGLKLNSLFSDITLAENHIQTVVTLMLPSTPLGQYVNVSWGLRSIGSSLEPVAVQLGKITIPDWVVKPILGAINSLLLKSEFYQNVMENAESIQHIAIDQNSLRVVYEWNPNSLAKLEESGKTLLVPRDYQEKLVVYYNELGNQVKPFRKKKVSLAIILKPMFNFAFDQAKTSNDPVQENRVLLQSLALYSTRRDLTHAISADLQTKVKKPVQTTLTLHGRSDLAKHFLVSSALSVSAGSSLANFIGLVKEVEDSNGGSGFSFADLAADKAGVKIGELAITSPQVAQKVQHDMRLISGESGFMPSIDSLPEGIMALEFKKRYTDLDSKSYSLVNDEISKRISRCQVFQ